MATLKVGQRVRIVNCYRNQFSRVGPAQIGKSAVILRAFDQNFAYPELRYDWWVITDDGVDFIGPNEHFAPLTDPLAENLIAQLNKQMSAPVGPVVPVKVPA